MKLPLLFCLCLFFTSKIFASYPEFFGASFSTSFIGNQANLDANDPSNNYYAPAVLGFSKKVNALVQVNSAATHFSPMSNIVVTNDTNSTSGTTFGNVANDYQKFYGMGLHFALPVGYEHLGTLGLSLFLPIGHLMETNSGDPFKPEYVMYHSRYQRSSLYLNFAKKFNENLAFSLGTILGYQASASVKTNLSLGGTGTGSWGSARSLIDPSLGIIASVVMRNNNAKYYFTFQQEMKSNLHAEVNGEITNPPLPIFEANIDSMIFYDPHTFRLGSSIAFAEIEFFSAIEYQIWSGYKPPIITFTKTGGAIVSSSAFENINIQDTINPRIGMKWDLTNRLSTGLGFAYRMSPLNGNFSGSGNSIDTNTYIFSTGLQYRIVIWSKDVNLGTSFEYQQLESKHVEKSVNQENGNGGLKIGAGGYDINGHVIAASFGIKFNF